MDKYFNNLPLLKAVLKWKWHIIVLTIIATVLGVIFSGPKLITPRYKSEAVVYPRGLVEFSDETYTEQMLQVMESQEIMDSIVEIFNLMNHYEIDKNYIHAKTALKIRVLDEDPEMAYNIVNEILRLYNIKFGEIYKSKKIENARLYKNNLDNKYKFIDSLKRDLARISEDGEMINYLYLSKGNSIAYFSDGNNNSKNISEAIALVELIASETAAYSEIKIEYEKELRQAEGEMTFLNVVSRPFIADKKTYPVRWIIVALSCIGTFLFSILLAISIEKFNTKN